MSVAARFGDGHNVFATTAVKPQLEMNLGLPPPRASGQPRRIHPLHSLPPRSPQQAYRSSRRSPSTSRNRTRFWTLRFGLMNELCGLILWLSSRSLPTLCLNLCLYPFLRWWCLKYLFDSFYGLFDLVFCIYFCTFEKIAGNLGQASDVRACFEVDVISFNKFLDANMRCSTVLPKVNVHMCIIGFDSCPVAEGEADVNIS